MPKKLAVFCDGTWNELRMVNRTNVSLLAQCVAPYDYDGNAQLVFYDEGVGVGQNVSKLVDSLHRSLGGAFGRGLDKKIEMAYLFIALNYEPGDDIYIIGFSRGGYTARSLCGLIRQCGILRRDRFDQVPAAFGHYRSKTMPNSQEMKDFRKRFSHRCAAGPEDYDEVEVSQTPDETWDFPAFGEDGEVKEGTGRPRGIGETRESVYQFRPIRSYRMMYVGIWDTVGSLGVPARFNFGNLSRRRYDFHDTNASSLLSSIRHAVSIDEDRRVFLGTPFENILALNREWAAATGWSVDDPTDTARYVPERHLPYQQWWFPGDHGAVGGGNAEPGLSSGALLWIAQGAADAGLVFSEEPTTQIARAFELQNSCAQWRVRKDGSVRPAWEINPFRIIGGIGRRTGKRSEFEIGDTAVDRWLKDPSYRPRAINGYIDPDKSPDQVWADRLTPAPPSFPPRARGVLSADCLVPR